MVDLVSSCDAVQFYVVQRVTHAAHPCVCVVFVQLLSKTTDRNLVVCYTWSLKGAKTLTSTSKCNLYAWLFLFYKNKIWAREHDFLRYIISWSPQCVSNDQLFMPTSSNVLVILCMVQGASVSRNLKKLVVSQGISQLYIWSGWIKKELVLSFDKTLPWWCSCDWNTQQQQFIWCLDLSLAEVWIFH